jgi:hypothetical protein
MTLPPDTLRAAMPELEQEVRRQNLQYFLRHAESLTSEQTTKLFLEAMKGLKEKDQETE